jgi:hypothetical protein
MVMMVEVGSGELSMGSSKGKVIARNKQRLGALCVWCLEAALSRGWVWLSLMCVGLIVGGLAAPNIGGFGVTSSVRHVARLTKTQLLVLGPVECSYLGVGELAESLGIYG